MVAFENHVPINHCVRNLLIGVKNKASIQKLTG